MNASKHNPVLPAGRKPDPREVLDAGKRAKVLALLSLGCSRRMAARKVPCAHSTITRTARRDPHFAAELAAAESQPDRDFQKLLCRAERRQRKSRCAAAPQHDRMSPLCCRETADLLRVLLSSLAHFDTDVSTACPKCRGIAQAVRVLNVLSAILLQQQPACAPAVQIHGGGAHSAKLCTNNAEFLSDS
jgi:hypothetical protein